MTRHLYNEDQTALRETVRRFVATEVMPAATNIDRSDRFPAELYRHMAELGLFGVCLPEEAGGAGLNPVSACMVIEEIACGSGSLANCFALPVEAALFLHEHGTAAQQALIPGILDGSLLPASCVSEPDHGSDVAGMRSLAVRDGDDYVINGTKAWVTFGAIADFYTVFAKTSHEPGHGNITCFLVEGDRPGIGRGKVEDLLGMHGLEDCQVTFQDVRVPEANIIGLRDNAFRMAMKNFNFSRLLMASMAIGMAQAALEDAQAYARSRKQFGVPILSFQAIQFMLADMSTEIAAARLLVHHAAKMHGAGHSIAREAAHAKLFATDMANRCATNALQIHGGNGYSREYRIERIFRDVRLSQIYEGTNQIQRLIIARDLERNGA